MNNLKIRNNKRRILSPVASLMVISLFLLIPLSCKNKAVPESQDVTGSVKDENGNPYPNALVELSNGTKNLETKTDSQGKFSFDTEDIGTYEVQLAPPLSTVVITANPAQVEVGMNQSAIVNFVIKPQILPAHLVIGAVDIFGEIRNEAGDYPVDPAELIYARTVFDPPYGRLFPIKAPDDHHLRLSEWQTAQGTALVTCDGDLSTVDLALEGLIPNGTYTLWCNFLNKKKSVGESVSFGFDVERIRTLGSSEKNVVIAGADGRVQTSIEHPSCLLTEATALVLVIDYHINGRTFGQDHIPDEEDVTHLLVYFQ